MPRKEPFSYITGLSYGPAQNEYTRATTYGPFGNKLGTYDVAATADIRQAHPIGSTFTYNGQTYRVADSSFGGPKTNTLEFRDTPNNQRINPADIQWNSSGSGSTGLYRFDQNASASPFEWYPKEGGMLGKIASHLPGVTTYLAGQTVFDFLRSGLGKLLGGGGQQGGGQQAGNAGAPGFGSLGDYAPKPFVPPPWVMPDTTQTPAARATPATPGPSFGGIDPFGRFDPNMIHSLVNPENQFISGLIDWNAGQANPTGREPGLFENAGAGWLARHPIGQAFWNLGAGGRGPGAAGIMPGRQK